MKGFRESCLFSLHSVDLALCCCYQCWDYMDKCNYPLDSICPCLKETQLCLCTAGITGTEFSLSKEKFRTAVWKSLCKAEVFFPKMPPVSSVFQWRNWTHPRSSFHPFHPLPAVPRLPKIFHPFSCPFPLSSCFCGLSPVLPTPIPHGNQLQLRWETEKSQPRL